MVIIEMINADNKAHSLARLNADARDRKWPLIRPADAATMLLMDTTGRKPRLLLGKRNANLKFMPGKFVFPGGRVDPADRQMVASGALDAACESRLAMRVSRPSTLRGRALALAAIRETYEETGMLIGSPDLGTPKAPDGSWQAFAAQGIFPNIEALTFVARAITPPRRPKRFDTRFFMVNTREVGTHLEANIGPDAELVELVRVTFDEARKLDLPGITHAVINDVEAWLARGAGRHIPVPFYHEVRGSFIRELL
jgi:8-oxo-dGTP pyrophosphatase MutT (NUDIX family)